MDAVAEAPPPDELNPTNAAALGQVAEALDPPAGDGGESRDAADRSWEESFGRADDEITTRVDVSAYLDAKRRSMDCHRTQRQDLGWLLELPEDLAARAMSTEYFVLRWVHGADAPSGTRETSLLA
jgi:LmbE family N-acetylglucosaminyl deacetylase